MNITNQSKNVVNLTRIKLSALWVALMLTYLLGDVMRIFSGDFVPGEMVGAQTSQGLYLGMAALFVMPIVMVYLNLTLKYKAKPLDEYNPCHLILHYQPDWIAWLSFLL